VANVTTLELLQPQVITETISKIRVGKGPLSTFFNWGLGMGKPRNVPGRFASFRTFNQTRQVPTFRAPNTGPAVIVPNPVGEQRVMMTRIHEKMVFTNEFLGNIAKIGGPSAEIDKGGADYVAEQMNYMAHRFSMGIELATAGFIRGKFYLKTTGGDYWVPVLSVPSNVEYFTVDFGIPSGNLNQLNMLGAGNIIDVSWDNPAANIVKQVIGVRSALVQLNGMELDCVLVSGNTWNYVINNISVRTVGGIADTPFDYYKVEPARDEKGNKMAGLMKGKLRALPWVDWYIIDNVLSIDGNLDPINVGSNASVGTLTQEVPDGAAFFLPTPDSTWCEMWHGGEWIAETPAVESLQFKQGFSAWKEFDRGPTTLSIVALLNFLPVPKISSALVYGTVVF
jgi:hypothetical protein